MKLEEERISQALSGRFLQFAPISYISPQSRSKFDPIYQYNLTFLDDSTPVQTMVLQASGCERLLITNNSQNMRMTNQAFQAAFLKLISLPSLIPYPTLGA